MLRSKGRAGWHKDTGRKRDEMNPSGRRDVEDEEDDEVEVEVE
jgi:hypothetical protein